MLDMVFITMMTAVMAPTTDGTETFACQMAAFSDSGISDTGITGGTDMFTGIVEGWIVSSDPTSRASFQCQVFVNGVLAKHALIADFESKQSAQSAQEVHYLAEDTDTVQLCATRPTGTKCVYATSQLLPPQELYDLSQELYDFADAAACPYLVWLSLIPNNPVSVTRTDSRHRCSGPH
jgi:hypothetical protein